MGSSRDTRGHCIRPPTDMRNPSYGAVKQDRHTSKHRSYDLLGAAKKKGAGGKGSWGTWQDDLEDCQLEHYSEEQLSQWPQPVTSRELENACVFLPNGGFVLLPADIADRLALDELLGLAEQVEAAKTTCRWKK